MPPAERKVSLIDEADFDRLDQPLLRIAVCMVEMMRLPDLLSSREDWQAVFDGIHPLPPDMSLGRADVAQILEWHDRAIAERSN